MVVDLCSCSALGNYSLFLFYSTGFVRPSLSRLRPNQMPKYMLLKSRRSFACSGVWIRTRAQCLGSVVALIWWRRGITAWHTLVSCTRFFLPKVPKRETKKKDPNLVPVPLLLPCNTNPSQIVLRLVRPSVNVVTVLSRPVANPCQSYSPPTPSSRSSSSPSPVFAFLRFCFLIYIYILFLQKFTQID